ncbi:MAG: adenylate/guanylate cyclase domain-containing protein [Gallionella sp.]
MSQRVEKLAVLFADICGSTSLYENLGDDSARKLIFQCINAMSDEIYAGQGTLVKTIGDEVMATFPTAEAAFHAACSIRNAVESNQQAYTYPLHIRVGFNYGPVIKEFDDVFGNTVNVASRVSAMTRAGQVMATQAVYDELPAELRGRMRQILRAELKGKQDRFDLYQVIVEQEDMLSTRIGMPAYRKTPEKVDELNLRYRGRSIRLNKECRSVVLGRDETCDLVVHNELASRLHIHVEFRSGKFLIVDQSTNGTYVRFSDGNVAHITREEIYLQGNGAISLGQPFAENPDNIIEFSISTADPGQAHEPHP